MMTNLRKNYLMNYLIDGGRAREPKELAAQRAHVTKSTEENRMDSKAVSSMNLMPKHVDN